PSYTITMTPTGTQTEDGALTLNSAGVKTPASKWQ
ncbi:MAG: prepilin-type cleavage/methylation domain-containing protein, partial [Mehylophilales bacterium 35-46-6]